MLIGAGALHATSEVLEVSERLGAGVAKALLGKAAVPDDAPRVTGAIGLVGTDPSYKLMAECDTLLMVGSGFPYSEFLPPEGAARGVQIDISGEMLSLRYPMEVNLIGDSAETLRQLLPLLKSKQNRTWRNRLSSNIAAWWKTLEERSMNTADPLNPQRVFWELSSQLPEGCMVTCDSGSAAVWYARDVRLREGMLASLSGGLASMGCAVPYALAAKLAHPDRPVVALVGDGAMQMNGINELITIAKYRGRFEDPRFVILVLNNRDLNMVTWEQRGTEGDPRFAQSQDVPEFRYADYARLLGIDSILVTEPEQVQAAWQEAFAATGPYLIEARTDRNVPLIPPHVTFKQTKSLASAILKGDVDAADVVKAVYRELRHDSTG
jgi:pyruvate dehydrogenase (quinone)